MTKLAYIITHPDVIIDPQIPVPRWPLSATGRERMRKLLAVPWVDTLGAVYSSSEQKAMDGAQILAESLGLVYQVVPALDEIDRSATGYMPAAEHAATADEFFEHPDRSIRGWETANAAQSRMVRAVETVIDQDRGNGGNLAILSHGAVATLYLCYLKGCPIRQRPLPPGKNGGCYYCLEVDTKFVVHDWRSID